MGNSDELKIGEEEDLVDDSSEEHKHTVSLPVEEEQAEAFHIADVYFANGKPRKFVKQGCNLLEGVCHPDAKWCYDRKALMKMLLLPLVAFEDGSIELESDNEVKQVALSSVIRSVQHLVQSENLDYDTVKGLLIFSLSKFSCMSKISSEQCTVKTALCALLRACSQKSIIPRNEKLIHIQEAAKSDNWEAWEVLILSIDHHSGIDCSIDTVCNALEDCQTSCGHVSTLSAILSVLSVNINWVPLIMRKVGAPVLQLVKLYGVCQLNCPDFDANRTTVCAMSMKMIMITFQCMNTDKVTNDETVAFYMIVFQALVSIVSFNGLPSQGTDTLNARADPALGRICAQFFVHVLRTAPTLFKACLVQISVEDRNVLETAVRADMEGYQKKKVVAVKKTLKLKAFIKS